MGGIDSTCEVELMDIDISQVKKTKDFIIFDVTGMLHNEVFDLQL